MSTLNSMNSFAEFIRLQRTSRNLTLRHVSTLVGVDPAILSKTENGHRKATRELVKKLAAIYQLDENELLELWFKSKWTKELKESDVSVSEPITLYLNKRLPTIAEIGEALSSIFNSDSRILKAFLFGSFASKKATSGSDIDILLEIDENSVFTLFDLAEIKHKAQKATDRTVDIVTKDGIPHDISESVNKHRKLLYEKE